MDRLEVRRLSKQLEVTLTPQQRQLLIIGRSIPDEMLTPKQAEILKQMAPHLEGLTFEESRRLGAQDVFEEGFEAGQVAGKGLGIGLAVLLTLVLLALLVAHC
jgi:hypothetical protein